MTHHQIGQISDLLWRPEPGVLPQVSPDIGTFKPEDYLVKVVDTKAGVKFDEGKPDMSLLPAEALEEMAAVLTFGAKKYSPNNWRKGFKWTRLAASLLRHTFAWMRGEDKDPESGRSHLAHAGCCILFLLTFVLTGAGEDDRYKAS